MADPIQELVFRLAHGLKPTSEWLARWSAAGEDPVLAAWKESEDPNAMVELLRLWRLEELRAEAARSLEVSYQQQHSEITQAHERGCALCAEAVRVAVAVRDAWPPHPNRLC